MPSRVLSVAVLISGSGRTLRNLIIHIREHSLPVRIAAVLSSVSGAGGLRWAQEAGIPTITVPRRDHPDTDSFSRAVTGALAPYPVDLVLLAGFLHLWRFPDAYRNRVLNIHPALLPEFGGKGFHGRHVHEAVLRAGRTESGCTVHVADHRYDHGPVILQRCVPVLPDDTVETLQDRVFRAECELYPEVLRKISDGSLRLALLLCFCLVGFVWSLEFGVWSSSLHG